MAGRGEVESELRMNSDAQPHLLFVCGRNQWRSPTAAHLYANDPRIEVRSAGLAASSRHRINKADVEWADLILVMEPEQKKRIQKQFYGHPSIECMDIPDLYVYMDDTLVTLIQERVEDALERHFM